jgi:Nitroreductase family
LITFKRTPSYELVSLLAEKSTINDIRKMTTDSNNTLQHTIMNGFDAEEIFNKRSSVRFFDDRPVDYFDLLNILKENHDYAESIFGTAEMFEQYAIIRNVNNSSISPKSLYVFNPEKKNLEIKTHFAEEKMTEFFLQKEFIDAPATIVLIAKLERFIEEYNDLSGYKTMLIQSGSILHHSWLHSLGLGYTGTVFAGFNPNSLYDLTDVDGYRKYQALAFSFGFEKTSYLKGGE